MSIDRYQQAKALRDQGKTYAEIGRMLGVSAERARQIISQHAVVLAREDCWTEGLPTRIAELLRRRGYGNKEEVRQALENGDLRHAIRMERGIGRASIAKLMEWIYPHAGRTASKQLEIARAIALLEREGVSINQER